MVAATWAAIGVAFLSLLGFWTESRAGRRSLEAKIDKLGSDLRGEINAQTARIDAQTARIDAQTARMDHLSERVEEHLRSHA
ncbi:MAG: hypothetical protein ACYDH5_10655 [Acidimicrobiales bacterium]